MRFLVITQSYPDAKNIYAGGFIHVRNSYYLNQNITTDVVSFACTRCYRFEGIDVYPAHLFKNLISSNTYDAIICHAPNLRNHLRLILPIIARLPKIFFIFHGHELLYKSRYYPEPYKFTKKKFHFLTRLLDKAYDRCKCFILRQVIKRYGGKRIFLIFVSQYLQILFENNIGLPLIKITKFSKVITNPIHPIFIETNYEWQTKKEYDFITIRPFDKSVYASDLILEIARRNPNSSFHIYGQGNFFKYNSPPANVKVIQKFITSRKLPKLLNKYKAALMPSYHDSQGVMVCEMAAFGIPLVVSDIPASREMLGDTQNILFINNNKVQMVADTFLNNVEPTNRYALKHKFSTDNTVNKELQFICRELLK